MNMVVAKMGSIDKIYTKIGIVKIDPPPPIKPNIIPIIIALIYPIISIIFLIKKDPKRSLFFLHVIL